MTSDEERGLSEGSAIYHRYAEVYGLFSQAEDAPKKVAEWIIPKIRGKAVLDIGCGGGKYAGLLASEAIGYFGIDSSYEQIGIAREAYPDGIFAQGCASRLPVHSQSVDTAIAAWAIGSIRGDRRRQNAIMEAGRVVRPGGCIYLVENDDCGEFQSIRGEEYLVKSSAYNTWLIEQGFSVADRVKTYFEFSTINCAKMVFEMIWGKTVSDNISNRMIGHDILIFTKEVAHE
ncbi:MAG: class I SAM-dependent methyltransferase [Nanoarchaeota archaeon]